jgi:amino acid transporter
MSSVVIGVASTAAAYSLAATLGAVALAVGLQSPAVIVLAFIPMLFIAVAYQQLNRVDPDCGTTFTWATRAFGPHAGWMGGWAMVAADIIVMANLAQIAGQYDSCWSACPAWPTTWWRPPSRELSGSS